MPFPENLRVKLNTVAEKLKSLDAVKGLKYRIADLAPCDVIREDFDDSSWLPSENVLFRRGQGVTWIRTNYIVPEYCEDLSIEGAELRIMSDNLVYVAPIDIYVDGKLLLSETVWMDFKCPEAIITKNAKPGRSHTIAFRFDFNDKCFWEDAKYIGKQGGYRLRIIADNAERSAKTIRSIISELEHAGSFEGAHEILPRAYALLDVAVDSGRTSILLDAINKARTLFEPFRDVIKKNKVYLIGHAHIDMNWYWGIEETERVVGRDFATMNDLMDQYDGFKFSQSQCATYRMTELRFPEIFKKIQQRTAEGRWDITASTWVEGDVNMVSGESLVRQILCSKRYLEDKLGVEPKIMWCPDSFGHSANLPQIIKKGGMDYYFHCRCGLSIDKSRLNSLEEMIDARHVPIYWWKGQDGSRVLSVNMAGGEINAQGICRISETMRLTFGYDKAMYVYGVSDHGGGPTIRDIEWMREIRSLPTTPSMEFSTTEEFYKQVEADNPCGIPERAGEMNCVFDGCYTTHADIKWYNRRCESALESIEKLLSTAAQLGYEYPKTELAELWRTMLFNQFHDILDGCGVEATYAYSNAEAQKVLDRIRELEAEALRHIAGSVNVSGAVKRITVFNPIASTRSDRLFIPIVGNYRACDSDGNTFECQSSEGGTYIWARDLPSIGYKVLYLMPGTAAEFDPIRDDGKYLYISTKHYDIELQKTSGQITTLYDKDSCKFVVRRESIGWLLKNGVLNTLQIHYEEPTPMSSWTIGNVRLIKNLIDGADCEIIEDGPLLKRVRIIHKIDASSITQDIVITDDGPRIDFETTVDWNEWGDDDRDAPMLKVCFTPDIKNANAVYEIPFGAVTRLTGDFEYPALRWVDISDGDYGFALLNDSKHGYKCRGNGLELTLIRSGWMPDQKSDIGKHQFVYSILPHSGCYTSGNVVAEASYLNNPVLATIVDTKERDAPAALVSSGINGHRSHMVRPASECYSMLMVDNTEVQVAAVKQAEEGTDFIVRLFNTANEEINTKLTCGFEIYEAEECDFLERRVSECIKNDSCSLKLVFRPFEIKTIRIN